MKVGLVALFLPRLELSHLEEWIEYHLGLGVSHIYLYNNGYRSRDPLFGSSRGAPVWNKKPEADYHLDLTDREVKRGIKKIIARFDGQVKHRMWTPRKLRVRSFRTCQLRAVNHELARQRRLHQVDWLGHFDIDELLVFGSGSLSDLFASVADDVSAISVRQKLFESRWNNSKSVPYCGLTSSFGVLGFNKKLFARIDDVRRWVSPHQLRRQRGSVWRVPPEALRFHHFRGNRHFGKPGPRRWSVRRYCSIDGDPQEFDASHVIDRPALGHPSASEPAREVTSGNHDQ